MFVPFGGRLLCGTFGGRQREAREQQGRERRMTERVAKSRSHTCSPVIMNGRPSGKNSAVPRQLTCLQQRSLDDARSQPIIVVRRIQNLIDELTVFDRAKIGRAHV